jgi:hypothetical protein
MCAEAPTAAIDDAANQLQLSSLQTLLARALVGAKLAHI